MIDVEDAEYMSSEGSRVIGREELLIYASEFLKRQQARRIVLTKPQLTLAVGIAFVTIDNKLPMYHCCNPCLVNFVTAVRC